MSYVIEVHPTHLIARGTVPVAAVAAITSLAPARAVPDVDLQERADASLYLVVPEAAAALRAKIDRAAAAVVPGLVGNLAAATAATLTAPPLNISR